MSASYSPFATHPPDSTHIFRRLLCLAALILVSVLGSPSLVACDACNLAFGAELEGARADSLIARDFRKAVHNQGNLLKDSGWGSGAFRPNQATAEAEEAAPEQEILMAQAGEGSSPDSTSAVEEVVETQATAAPTRPTANLNPGQPPFGSVPDEWKNDEFIEIIERDYGYSFPPTSYVPQDTKPDKSFTLTLSEGKAYIGNGVIYDGFLTNDTVPGPLLVVEEGDIVEVIIENKGTVPHGASIHAAYTQTSKYLGKIQPGATGRVVFRVTIPGVYMYHCAPGGHAIPMHVLFGQYGMMVVKPKSTQYEMEKQTGRKPDIEIYMVQHEFYASGADAVNGKPMYTTFNGKLFRFVEEPIKARPGDFVRIYFLNVGPNLLSTFHIVGIIWDYVYWQGNPEMVWPGGQTITAGPSDSWIIDFRVPPDEGAYTMLTHAVGSASRGAIGLIVAEKDVERTALVTPEGPAHSPQELEEMEEKAVRVISPFQFTEFDKPVRPPPGSKTADVTIIGNSYQPKVLEIEPGTEVTWTNEDVFAYFDGEFSGVHNAAGHDGGDESFNTPLLAHGETASHLFEKEGVYEYTCAPHPYMKGKIIVKKSDIDLSNLSSGAGSAYLLPLAIGAFLIALLSFFRSKEIKNP